MIRNLLLSLFLFALPASIWGQSYLTEADKKFRQDVLNSLPELSRFDFGGNIYVGIDEIGENQWGIVAKGFLYQPAFNIENDYTPGTYHVFPDVPGIRSASNQLGKYYISGRVSYHHPKLGEREIDFSVSAYWGKENRIKEVVYACSPEENEIFKKYYAPKSKVISAEISLRSIPINEIRNFISIRKTEIAEKNNLSSSPTSEPLTSNSGEKSEAEQSDYGANPVSTSSSGKANDLSDAHPDTGNQTPTPYNPGVNTQYQYDPQAWAKFNQSQQQVKQWTQDLDRQIELGEQQRKMKAQAYDQIATDLATNIVNIANQIEAKKEQERINKRTREINQAVKDCYAQLYGDIDYWRDFQNQLIDFGNTHKSVIPRQAIENLEQSIKAILDNLQGIDRKIKKLDEEVEYHWSFARDMNDVFRFPLRSFQARSYGKTNPGIGYNLVTILNSGAGIPNPSTRSSYISGAAVLLAEYAVDVQNYDYVLSAESAYRAGNGSGNRYQSLVKSAHAIKEYLALKGTIQTAYDAFEKDLKSKKGLVILKNSDARVRFQGITPVVGQVNTSSGNAISPTGHIKGQLDNINSQAAQTKGLHTALIAKKISENASRSVYSYRQSMTDLFPQINDLTEVYKSLKPQMGEFAPLYPRYDPGKIAKLEAEGFYVEPGEATLTLSVKYMEPSPLKAKLHLAGGESKTIDLAAYFKTFTPNQYFRPFDVLDHKKERFNRRNNFNIGYTLYNMGISEASLTFYGNQRYATMRSYQDKRGAFFTNVEIARVFYGKSKITTGFQDATGDSYDKHTVDFSYIGGEFALFGLGYVQRLFRGGGMLELQGATSLLSYYHFRINASTTTRFGSQVESLSGNYPLGIAHYAVLHGVAGLSIPMGRNALNIRYRYNFYPLVEMQNDIGDKGDISKFEEDYPEAYTPFYKDLFENYFTHSLTFSFAF